ncbi:MAG: lysine exporter LysO family protein [Deltaproteobacteria bacterium]|nr:lysine exporter LysO family protein [Deltaproteobacteria bacterium]
MIIELVCFTGGILPGHLLRRRRELARLTGLASLGTIYALLFIMGARLGGDAVLFASLRQIGFRGVIISVCCAMGSVLLTLPLRGLFAERGLEQRDATKSVSISRNLRSSFVILFFFCLGVLLGTLDMLPLILYGETLFTCIVRLMLFCIGMGMGFDSASFLIVRDLGLRAALVPLLAAAGTAIGAVLAFILLPGVELRETLVAGAGFGYYSLAGAIISNHGNLSLGSIAMFANLSRELFSLLSAPLLVRFFGPLAPVAASGATGMDTCLPVIVHCTNERFGIVAVFNGLCLSLLVPLLIPLLFSLLY